MRRVIYWYPFGTDLKDKTKQKATKSRETKEADLTPDGRRATATAETVEPITSGFFFSVFYHPHIPRTKAK